MNQFIPRKSLISFAIGALAGIAIAPSSLTADSSSKLEPETASGCAGLYVAYQLSVTQYEAAQQAMNDAWAAYYSCEYGGGQRSPEHEAKLLAETRSIVER